MFSKFPFRLRDRNISSSSPKTPSPSPVKAFWLMVQGGITVLILLFLANLLMGGSSWVAGLRKFLTIEVSEPQADISTLIVKQIRSASELTTAVYTMETVVPTEQNRAVGPLKFTSKLIYIAYGEVEAGIDLSQLDAQDITLTENQITVKLPPPEILDSEIDLERSKVYHYDRGVLNFGPDAAHQLQTLAQKTTLEKIVTAACEQDILGQASDRAKVAMTQLLNLSGHENVEIQVAAPDAKTCAERAREEYIVE